MTKLIIISSFLGLALGACATTRTGSTPPHTIGTGAPSIALDLERDGSTVKRSALVRQSIALLPSADRIRHELRADGHELLTASVRLCVAPDGSSAGVDLIRSSGVGGFDAALVRDAAAWEFDAYAAPRAVQVCEPVTVSYIP